MPAEAPISDVAESLQTETTDKVDEAVPESMEAPEVPVTVEAVDDHPAEPTAAVSTSLFT